MSALKTKAEMSFDLEDYNDAFDGLAVKAEMQHTTFFNFEFDFPTVEDFDNDVNAYRDWLKYFNGNDEKESARTQARRSEIDVKRYIYTAKDTKANMTYLLKLMDDIPNMIETSMEERGYPVLKLSHKDRPDKVIATFKWTRRPRNLKQRK